jgi:hypothetical protein
LLTPWSVYRSWVWADIGAAWGQRKRYVGVLYGLTMGEVEKERGGLAMSAPIIGDVGANKLCRNR